MSVSKTIFRSILKLPKKTKRKLMAFLRKLIYRVISSKNLSREDIKEFYPGMEDIVDILLDNNIPFSHEGVFELTDENNAVIASAAMIIDNPKIAIDPSDNRDKVVFEERGYKTISQSEFSINLFAT